MNAGTLATIEWFKARRRITFWAATAALFTMLVIGFGTTHYFAARAGNAQRGTLWGTFGGLAAFAQLIVLVTVVLLTSAERTWRTERQNIIDGMSRNEYFLGKLFLVIGFVLLLWTGGMLITLAFELLNRGLPGAAELALLPSDDLRMLLHLLLYLFFVGCMALFFGISSASSGSGLALAFIFLFAQVPLMLLMAKQGGIWQDATAYLPMTVLQTLMERPSDTPRRTEMLEIMRQNGMPLSLPAARNTIVAVTYCAVFSAAAWLSIRKRDL